MAKFSWFWSQMKILMMIFNYVFNFNKEFINCILVIFIIFDDPFSSSFVRTVGISVLGNT